MNDSVVATTALGQLAGRQVDGVAVFRGVPYAMAPRFGAPVAAAGWNGVRDAGTDGAVSFQPPSRLRLVMGDIAPAMAEDCLNLTIFTPAADGAARPVLVWFHGGGYSSGAGSLAWYDGTRLAREGDVVVVGVNYRLGPLGYLYLPGVVPGNLGLRDQQLALDWVARHIGGFGGDAGNVTLIGQSAGGHSIACLMTRPESRVRFRRAIIQSPPLGLAVQSTAAAEKIGRLFVQAAGIDPDAPDATPDHLAAERHWLGPRLTLAHGVWLDDAGIAEIAAAGASVAINPLSNLKTKNGAAPIRALLEAGVNVGIGCDNCSCSDAQNMFQAMKTLTFLAAISNPAEGPPDAVDAFRAATMGGARALGFDIGRIAPGLAADLVLLDMADPVYQPLNSAMRQIVYGESGRSVETVIVNGRVVMRDRWLATIDEAALRAELSSLMPAFRRAAAEVFARTAPLRAHIAAADRRIWAEDVGFSRYVGF